MQTQNEIRLMLAHAGLAPNKALGQNFLVDHNLLAKLLELADVGREDVVLEVGPGTGSLTEELAARARRVVAVEIDRGLHGLLRDRLAALANVQLLHTDALAGKHELSPAVLQALGDRAVLVSNLPYCAATPIVAECLLLTHRWGCHGCAVQQPWPGAMPIHTAANSAAVAPVEAVASAAPCRFDRLTFTVQREVADRMTAVEGEEAYGPLSVIVAVLGNVTAGPVVPPGAFWPRPNVSSRMVRIDFDESAVVRLHDAAALTSLVGLAFGQRRKQIGSLLRREDSPFDAERLAAALDRAGVDRTLRPEQIAPARFLEIANALHGQGPGPSP